MDTFKSEIQIKNKLCMLDLWDINYNANQIRQPIIQLIRCQLLDIGKKEETF